MALATNGVAVFAESYLAAKGTLMGSSDREGGVKETLRSLSMVVGIAIFFFLWGLTIFFTVGEKGPPSWDFGTVQDIPGESTYSTQRIKEIADLMPLPVETQTVVDKQHVDEVPRKAGVLEEKR
jgi:hypothetical protein